MIRCLALVALALLASVALADTFNPGDLTPDGVVSFAQLDTTSDSPQAIGTVTVPPTAAVVSFTCENNGLLTAQVRLDAGVSADPVVQPFAIPLVAMTDIVAGGVWHYEAPAYYSVYNLLGQAKVGGDAVTFICRGIAK